MLTPERKTIALLSILLLALFLRVVNNTPEFASYWYDEAEYSLRAMHIVDHGGAYDPHFLRDHPPLFMYILAGIFSAFGSSWLVARGFVVLLGVATTLVLFLVGKALKDEKLGLICAAAFALSPLAVFVTREVVLEPLMSFFLFLTLLFLIRFDKAGRPRDGIASAVLLGLACITKVVAFVILIPLLFYVLKTKLHKKKVFWVSVAVFAVIVTPVYVMMLMSGFLGFHLVKFSDPSVYTVWGQPFLSSNFVSLLTFIGWVNVGFVPVALLAGTVLRANGWKFFRSLRGLSAINLFLVVWLLASLLFSLSYTVMGPHYDYSVLLPFIPLLAWAGYRYRRVLMIVLVVFLVVSLCGFLFLFKSDAMNETVKYVDSRIADGDSIISGDYSVMSYHFGDHEVVRLTAEDFLSGNHTFLVVDVARLESLLENASAETKIQAEYDRVYSSPCNIFDTTVYVYERTA